MSILVVIEFNAREASTSGCEVSSHLRRGNNLERSTLTAIEAICSECGQVLEFDATGYGVTHAHDWAHRLPTPARIP